MGWLAIMAQAGASFPAATRDSPRPSQPHGPERFGAQQCSRTASTLGAMKLRIRGQPLSIPSDTAPALHHTAAAGFEKT
tara:strand:- start:30653 stop:30889 length:237 start_codon:yes stop_codon:yes gene_type:complete